MTEIVKDLKRVAFLSGYIAGVKLDADKEAELRAIQAKYEKPFAPEQLIELGFEENKYLDFTDYIRVEGDTKLEITHEWNGSLRVQVYFIEAKVGDFYADPKTHTELLTLLKLVTGSTE